MATTQTVIVNIKVIGGERIKDVVPAVDNVSNSASRGSGAMSGFARSCLTLQKALVSMVGVLVAFNLFITLPEMILKGVVYAFKEMVKAAAEVQERVIALQAILASTQQFDVDPFKNFAKSGQIAHAVVMQMIQRNREFNGTIEEATLVFQTLVSGGIGAYVKNVQEAVDLSFLLVNAIGGVTLGQDRMRQFSSEVRAFMSGQLAPTATLARLLFKNTDEMKKFMDAAAKSKDFLGMMQDKLRGFVQAVEPLSQTFTGFKTSLSTMWTVFSDLAMRNVFGEARTQLNTFRKQFSDNMELVKRAAAATGAFVSSVFGTIFRTAGVSTGSFLNTFRAIDEGAARMAGYVAFTMTFLKNFWIAFKNIWLLIVELAGVLADLPILIIETLKNLYVGFNNFMNSITRRLGGKPLFPDLEYSTPRIVERFKALRDIFKDIASMQDPYLQQTLAEQEVRDQTRINMATINAYMKQQVDLQNELLRGERAQAKETAEERRKRELIAEANKWGYIIPAMMPPEEIYEKFGEDALRHFVNGFKANRIVLSKAMEDMGEEATKSLRKSGEYYSNVILAQRVKEEAARSRLSELLLTTLGRAEARGDPLAMAEQRVAEFFAHVQEQIEKANLSPTEIIWVKVVAGLGAAAIRANAVYDDLILKTKQFIDAAQTGLIITREWLEEFNRQRGIGGNWIDMLGGQGGLGQRIEDQRKLLAATRAQQDELMNASVGANPAQQTAISEQLKQLEQIARSAQSELNNLEDALRGIFNSIPSVTDAFSNFFFNIIAKAKTAGEAMKDFGKELLFSIAGSIGQLMTDVFTAAFQHESISAAFKKFVGQMLIQIGQMAVTYGSIGLLLAAFGIPVNVAAAAGLLAAGTAAIAAGAALLASAQGAKGSAGGGGSGGGAGEKSPPPQYVGQGGIAVQQYQMEALQANTQATSGLAAELGRLSKEKGDVLVSNAIKKNPSMVTKPLTSAMSTSFNLRRNFGGALVGETS